MFWDNEVSTVDRCIDSDRFTVDSFCHSGTVRPKYTYCMYALNMNLNIIDSLALFGSGREMCSARWAVLQELEMSKPYRLANHLNKCGLG